MVVYLRHLEPVRHLIPEPAGPTPLSDPLALEEAYGYFDYGAASTGP